MPTAPKMIKATVKIVDPTAGKAEVLKQDGPLPGKNGFLVLPKFTEGTEGDIWDVIIQVSNSGLSLVDIKTAQDVQQKNISDVEWIKRGTEYFSPSEHLLFNLAAKSLTNYPSFCIAALGDSGYGKTARFVAIAQDWGKRFVHVPCQMMRDTSEWFGYEEVRDTTTTYDESEFLEVLQEGNAVILLDEFSRVNPFVANALLNIMDFTRAPLVHGKRIKVEPDILFGITMNVGYQYTATYQVDAATARRINGTFRVMAPPPTVERKILMDKTSVSKEDAAKIVEVMNNFRSGKFAGAVNASTATAIGTAMLVEAGGTVRQAVEFTLVTPAPEDLRQDVLNIVNSELGVFSV